MTLNDLECLIHLKVRFTDSTLDVRLLRVSDSTIRIGVATGDRGEVGWKAYLPPPCEQLMRCFSAVAELLVLLLSLFHLNSKLYRTQIQPLTTNLVPVEHLPAYFMAGR